MSDILRGKPVVNVGALMKHAQEEQAAGRGSVPKGLRVTKEDLKSIPPAHDIDFDRVADLVQGTMGILHDPNFIAEYDRRQYELTAEKEDDNAIEGEFSSDGETPLLEKPVPLAMILVGLPGSGKSTLAKTLIDMHSSNRTLDYASSDAFIEEKAAELGKTYGEVFSQFVDAANVAYQRTLNLGIRAGNDILVDRTNVDKASRKKLIDKFKSSGYQVIAFEVKADPGVITERNIARKESGRGIPENVMEGFIRRYVSPTKSEGFDHVIAE